MFVSRTLSSCLEKALAVSGDVWVKARYRVSCSCNTREVRFANGPHWWSALAFAGARARGDLHGTTQVDDKAVSR